MDNENQKDKLIKEVTELRALLAKNNTLDYKSSFGQQHERLNNADGW